MNIRSLSKLRTEPDRLIENRISYDSPNAILSVYDTFEKCHDVSLDSDEFTFCGMLAGKKVLHVGSKQIDFMPKQSFVMSPGSQIKIDFPTASYDKPTTCIAISISRKQIKAISDQLNLHSISHQELHKDGLNLQDHLHEALNLQTQSLLQRLIQLFSEQDENRSALIELGISELIIRMLSQQSRNFLLSQLTDDPEKTGIHKALHYIHQNFHNTIEIDELTKLAYMSRSKFFEAFKRNLGCTPSEYIIQQRVEHAAKVLRKGKSVTQAAFDSGFSNMSHFSRRFFQRYGVTPKQFKEQSSSMIYTN